MKFLKTLKTVTGNAVKKAKKLSRKTANEVAKGAKKVAKGAVKAGKATAVVGNKVAKGAVEVSKKATKETKNIVNKIPTGKKVTKRKNRKTRR